MPNELCPLCDNMAEYERVHSPYGKRFTCQSCAEFFIDQSSEAYLSELPEVTKSETRKKLSASARDSGKDRLFVIREPRLDELGGDGQQIARTRMIAEWVSNKV